LWVKLGKIVGGLEKGLWVLRRGWGIQLKTKMFCGSRERIAGLRGGGDLRASGKIRGKNGLGEKLGLKWVRVNWAIRGLRQKIQVGGKKSKKLVGEP